MKKDNAFTGLEAAIVLIAFVVVAAVFSYVMLGAGFFATQKAQEVTYAGIKMATSNTFINGNIHAMMNGGSDKLQLSNLTFSVGVPEGGQAQSIANLVLLFANERGDLIEMVNTVDVNNNWVCDTGTAVPGYCWIFKDKATNSWSYLDDGEIKAISADSGDPANSLTIEPGKSISIRMILDKAGGSSVVGGQTFTIEVKPRVGAPYLVSKSLPTGFTGGFLT